VDDETREQEEISAGFWREGITVTLKNDKEFILKIPNADYYIRVVGGDASGAEEWVDAIEELVSDGCHLEHMARQGDPANRERERERERARADLELVSDGCHTDSS
jgi:hypothetical protein